MTAVIEQQPYPQLDMKGVHESVRAFNLAKAGRDFDFISSLQERVDSASHMMNGHTRTVLRECAGLEVIVGNAGFTEILNQWLKVSADSTAAEDVRNAVRDQIKAVYLNKVQRVVKATLLCESKIAPLLGEVAALNLEHYADPLMNLDAETLKRYEAATLRLQAKITDLTADKKLLDDAIDLLQSKTWWDHVKGILPTASEIETAVSATLLGKADASLIGVAVDRVTKYIDLVEEGRRFSSLVSARGTVAAELKIKTQELKDNKKEIDALSRRAEKITSHTQLLQGRDRWSTTFESIRTALRTFLDVCESINSATEEAITQAPKLQADFASFLRSLNK